MEISAFSLYFQEQLHNAYSYILGYIEFILPQMISFRLSYGLSLCNKNPQRYMFSNAPTCYPYVFYTKLFSTVCLQHVSLRVFNKERQAIAKIKAYHLR